MESVSERVNNLIYHNILLNWLGSKLPHIPSLFQTIAANKIVTSVFQIIVPFLPLVLVLFLIWIMRLILNLNKSLKQQAVLLEITPPVFTKESFSTEQLFKVIHDLGKRKSFKDKILGRKTLFSFEIVSTLNQGIRYIIRTTPKDANNIKRNLMAYLPQLQVKAVDEYLPENNNKLHTRVIEYGLTKHFAYPLQRYSEVGSQDPVDYITGMMTQLSSSEVISFQLIVSPTKPKEVNKISRMILRNEDVLGYLDKYRAPLWLKPIILSFGLTLKLIGKTLDLVGYAATELRHPNTQPAYAYSGLNQHQQMQIANIKPARVLSTFETQTIESVHQKIKQPLFQTSVRVLAVMKDHSELQNRIEGFDSPLSVFNVPEYQALNRKRRFPILTDKVRQVVFKHRLLSLLHNSTDSVLSVSEVSDLYHFPLTKVENVIKAHSNDLPAPISLKNNPDFDVVFGKNIYGGTQTDIGLTEEERKTHMYIIGRTGSGKTTAMFAMAKDDIENGKGIAFIDPDGDVSEDLLSVVPLKRIDDLIYFNPRDVKYPV